jgi:hypothetical protein
MPATSTTLRSPSFLTTPSVACEGAREEEEVEDIPSTGSGNEASGGSPRPPRVRTRRRRRRPRMGLPTRPG